MILVQNRQLPLSGNKIPAFLIVLCLFFSSSCGIFKPVKPEKPDYGQNDKDPSDDPDKPGKDPSEVPQPPGKVDTVEWTVEDPLKPPPKIAAKDPVTGVYNFPKERVTKSSYNMVILLPFFTNRMNPVSGVPSESTLALEFYEGVKMAIRQLEKEGVNMNVTVLDTQADTNKVKGFLYRSEMINADLIFGPVTRDNNRIVAQFAKNKGTAMVSPLNTRSDIARENPFYIQANPSAETVFTQLLRYINKRHKGLNNLIIIAPEGSTADARVEYLEEATKLIYQSPNPPPLNIVNFKLEEGAMLDIEPRLQRLDSNIVVIPSRDQGFVGFVMRELSLLRNQYPTIVYGMSDWQEFERIDFSYFENLSVHVPSSGFANKNNNRIVDFKRNYYNEYGMVPSHFAYKGYDTCLYFGRMLKEYGIYFQSFFDEADAVYMYSGFSFQPKYYNPGVTTEGNARIDQYENQLIDILEFHEYGYRRVARQRGN